MRWFVYVDIDYYPWAEFVEAETAEQASDIVRGGDPFSLENWATVVVPAESAQVFMGAAGEWRPGALEHEGVA